MSRILQRMMIQLKLHMVWTVLILALLVGGVVLLVLPHGPTVRVNTNGDCADTIMTNLDGPQSSTQNQSTWNCLGQPLQLQIQSEQQLERTNQQFLSGVHHQRVGQSQPHQDGTVYVYFDSQLGQQHAPYTITLDQQGKVIKVE